MIKTRFYLRSLLAIILFAVSLYAEKLPVRIYTADNGLANDSIGEIVRDSRGFLWFCTGEGLSRFDGFAFKNYTQNEGLPSRRVRDFLETRSGDLLVATRGGLAIFNPNGKAYRWNILESKLEKTEDAPPMFRLLKLPEPYTNRLLQTVAALGEDNQGRIYVGTDDGLFLLEKSGDEWRWITKIESEWWLQNTELTDFQIDRQGWMWTITNYGVFRISPELKIEKISDEGGRSLMENRLTHEIWATASGLSNGIRVYSVPADGTSPVMVKNYKKADGLQKEKFIIDAIQLSDNRIIVSDEFRAMEFLPDAKENEPKFRTIAEGGFNYLAEDSGGNLWLGTNQEGAAKLSLHGFVTFDVADGLAIKKITSLFTNSAGEFFVADNEQSLSRLKNGRFETIKPFSLTGRYNVINPLDFQSANGEWWIPSTKGLLRYPPIKDFQDLARTPPLKTFTTADGLEGDTIHNLFEDSRGDVWFIVLHGNNLYRWERKTEKIITYTAVNGLPIQNAAVAFAEDLDGNVWFGFYYGGVARFRNNKFEFFKATNGIPESPIGNIFRDKAGRLWISTTTLGVFRVDNPTAENPTFTNISTANGLSSNRATCATEDNSGRIYIGTGRGLNRIEPETGRISLYTQADGLPTSSVLLCQKDADGALWFSENTNLIRFIPPKNDSAAKSPPVFIGGVSVGGITQPVSEIGQAEVALPEFNHRQNNLQINFFSIGFAPADQMRFQYRLGDADWSSPTSERIVTFANLAPDNYEFAVRAVNADGLTSENPAIIKFTIAPPTWQKWWFIALCVLALGIVLVAFERYRAAKVKALKSAFGELSVSEERFRHLVEQSPLGIVVLNSDGIPRLVNQAYLKMWGEGFTLEHFRNWDFMNDEQLVAAGLIDGIKRTFGGEIVEFKTVRYDTQKNSAGFKPPPDSGVVYIDTLVYPVKNSEGESREFIFILQNNTEHYIAQENLEKVRAEKARELEQVRKRIAADLHDDIGSSLTQISILSEVLQQNSNKKDRASALDLIASSSRELVDTMSDIVWAINPTKDHLSDLTGKMHRFAADSFTPRKIKFTFDAPDLAEDLPLGANLRREVFLIFKEAVNNILKHANCQKAEIIFKIKDGAISLLVRDDGCGFLIGQNSEGHGLSSMKERATSLGGNLEISSSKGGTTIEIYIPLNNVQNSPSV